MLKSTSPTGLLPAHSGTQADGETGGGHLVVFSKVIANTAGDVDIIVDQKIQVIAAHSINTGIAAHATADTWQLKNGATAITDAVARTATPLAITRPATLDNAQATIAAGGTLRITSAKSTNCAGVVFIYAMLVP